jgi:3'-phosphoadenosine 5'-phosphosulfate sulfotransferase (PAPS reductase)/FAD synthetase
MNLNQRIEKATATLKALMVERPALLAISGGKDSSLCAVLVMRAAGELVAEGKTPMPILVSSSDTGVENPEVTALLHAMHESIQAECERLGIECRSSIVSPNLSEQWWPRMLAGRKLPSYAGVRGDCSVDMKIKPQERLARENAAWLAERHLPEPVTVVGTRFEESANRAANMATRGHQADTVVNGVIAPIADWSTDDVMVTLIDRDIEKFDHDYRSIIEFYGMSAGGECAVTPEQRMGAAQGGCSSRSGCFTCQKVTDDRSLAALASHYEYAYLRPLYDLNRYLRNIRWDFSRRSWIGRTVDPVTGGVRIAPNCLSFDEADRLLRMVLTLDVQESERAEAHAERLARGEIKDTPRNRRLARPQFQNLDAEALIAIDFMRATDGFGPAHSAVAAWRDVYVLGERYPVPEIEATPRPASMPEARIALLGDTDTLGAIDPLESMVNERNNALTPELMEGTFEIDAEGAELFFALEALERAELADQGAFANQAAHYYLRLGTVSLPHGSREMIDRQMTRAQFIHRAGLHHGPVVPVSGTLGEAEHQDMIWAEAGGMDVTRPQTPGGWAQLSSKIARSRLQAANENVDPDRVAERVIGLRATIAAGFTFFDGENLAQELRRAERLLSTFDESESLLADAWHRAMRVLDGEFQDTPSGLFPWVSLGEKHIEAHAPTLARQGDLFAGAA